MFFEVVQVRGIGFILPNNSIFFFVLCLHFVCIKKNQEQIWRIPCNFFSINIYFLLY